MRHDTLAFMAHQPLAYMDREFLESAEARPIRILAEYLEPLRRFKEQKIQDTVVFFGSARVDSRERAERALRTLRSRGERESLHRHVHASDLSWANVSLSRQFQSQSADRARS